ncbi:MAG: hypothetical protein AB7I27_16370 [Bacteriovoracaceae bacterium]
MKTFTLILGMTLIASNVYAEMGNSSGGGGDSQEQKVDEIRSDILQWIQNGGADGLNFSKDLSLDDYKRLMLEILQPKKVVVSFTNDQVRVNGIEKTCRGYISEQDLSPYIQCNISRFKDLSADEKYKLIHHEYAGLVQVEKNEGAASDYFVSSQMTEYLVAQKEYRLAIRNPHQFEWVAECFDRKTNKRTFEISFMRAEGETPQVGNSVQVVESNPGKDKITLLGEIITYQDFTTTNPKEIKTEVAPGVKSPISSTIKMVFGLKGNKVMTFVDNDNATIITLREGQKTLRLDCSNWPMF